VVVRGCTVSYFLSDKDAIMLRNPKGVVVVTGIEDTDPDGTMWTMQSAFKKDFFLSANSIDEKHRFMEAMLLAIEVQRNQFVNVDMESDNELRVHVAIEFARYGFLESAKLQFQSVLDSDPKNVHTLFHLGTCYLIEGNEAQSVDYLQKAQTQAALSDDPLLSQINCNLGVAQYILGMFDESIKSFESVLIISPGDEDIIVNESVVHIAAKNYSSAEKLLAPLLNNSKPSKNALLNWSEVMFANGKLSASIETLQRLVQLYPDCDEGYYKLGEIFETEGSKSSLLRAAECYQSALALQSHRFKYGDAVLRVQNLLADFE
jgi:tetratricopeptide (TPR) repeat protein